MKEVTKLERSLKELKKKLELENEAFDNSKGIKIKEQHLDNIRKIEYRIVRTNIEISKLKGTYIEEEDSIKAPWGYIASEEEFGMGFFRVSNEEEY